MKLEAKKYFTPNIQIWKAIWKIFEMNFFMKTVKNEYET